MMGLVMAGGKGTRMNFAGEKLLLKYKKPVILHVIDSLKNSGCLSKVLAVTSPNSPNTKKLIQENGVETVDTSGMGYVEDLNFVLQMIDDSALIVPGDLPLLDADIVQKIAGLYDSKKTWTSILVTKNFLDAMDIKPSFCVVHKGRQCHYTGISLVNSGRISSLQSLHERHVIVDDKRVALNLNTRRDYDLLGIA